jgi:hypothetical protein
VIAAARDTDLWVLLGIDFLAALVLVYFAPRLVGFLIVAPLRALAKARRRRPRDPQ